MLFKSVLKEDWIDYVEHAFARGPRKQGVVDWGCNWPPHTSSAISHFSNNITQLGMPPSVRVTFVENPRQSLFALLPTLGQSSSASRFEERSISPVTCGIRCLKSSQLKVAFNSYQLQVTIKRDDYRNKTAFEYSESARKPGRRAQFFFLQSGGTHDPFNLSKIVFQSHRCRESLSKVRALFFSKG